MSSSGAFETTTTGSRRAVRADERVRATRRRGPLLVAGLVLVLAALALVTIARPTATTTATARVGGTAPLVLSAPGLLESRPGPLTVRASGTGPVLLAVGSQGDVRAWARGAATSTLARLVSGGGVAVRAGAGSASVPDPAGSDLWVASARGTGAATLTWTPRAGRWLLLAAGSGSGPAPHRLLLSWQHRAAPWWAWPLLAAGLVLLVVGRPRRTRRAS